MSKHLRLLVLASLLSGCEHRGQDPYNPGPTQVSISITARNEMAGVQKLSVFVTPSYVMVDCANTDPRWRNACQQGSDNYRMFTDRGGLNRVVKAQGEPCPGTSVESTHYRCWAAENDLTMFDALAANTLPTAYIARDFELESNSVYKYKAFSSVIFAAWGRENERDSYVWLSDGRECEVKPLFQRRPDDIYYDVLPDTGRGSFPLSNLVIRPGDRWLIKLVVDLGTIDPAQCGTNQPLYMTEVSATAELLGSCPNRRRDGSCITDYVP